MNNGIRWGVLSTAKIGRDKAIPAMQKCNNSTVVAIASRNPEHAKETASLLGIETAYGSYDELLNDPTIDAIYFSKVQS